MVRILFLLLISSACFAQPKAVPSVSVSGTTATLSASASTGNIGSYYWTASPSVSFTNGVYYGGSNLGPLTATIKAGTRYTFILTVQDKGGAVGTASTVYDPTIIPAPVIITIKDTIQKMGVYVKGVLLVTVVVFSDGSTITIKP